MGEVRGVRGQVVYQRDGKKTKVVLAPLDGLAVLRAAGSLDSSPAAEYLRDELGWRLDA